ncbi:MAG: VacB/RNase II family 3'-5' exoribonuclease [Leptolyngbya sp. SIO4C5]|nr:VacB/RNase II family 3'-5' exoribonuclease [Leptolyngbya sp. SIO4C5]
MEKGKLIEFKHQGVPRLAVVDRPDGKKNWVVIDEQGQSHSLHPRQVTFQSQQATYTPADLPQFRTEAEAYIDPSSLEVAWEFLSEAEEAADPAALAQLLFSDQQLQFRYAAHRLLSEDKIYFKQKGDRYEPRPPAQVEEIQHQLNREAQHQQEWEGFLNRVRQILAGEPLEWQKSDRPRLEAIERLALFGEEAIQRALAIEALTAFERSTTPESAFQLLVDLGLWSVHENLSLKRSQIPTQFPEKVLNMVEQRLQNPPSDPDAERLDLTHLKVYTIDDESTREIDDGLSLEVLEGGQHKIWVHIADPTRWLIPGDEIELEARRRCTTVYLPTGMVPMFPSELATGPMSLVQGQICCALSFGICLSEAGEVEDYDIQPSWIKPTYRLTYEDVDEILGLGVEAESEISAIAQWSKVRQAWRQSQGAININMPESSVKVFEDDIQVEVLDISAARQLVAEMMILTGEVAARYGEAHNLAIPFRSQPQPELPSDEELLQLPYGWVRDSALRRCMPRSEMGTTPARHATLGLDRYSQVTSPIRRYTDLLAHFQLKAHLRGEPLPFSSSEMNELTQGAATAAYEAVLVERQTKRYWSIEYLRRRPDEVWPVMLLRWLREHEGLGLVILEDLGLELPMRFDRPADLGEHFQVRVAYANPREDVIHLVEVIEPEAVDTPDSASSALQI